MTVKFIGFIGRLQGMPKIE